MHPWDLFQASPICCSVTLIHAMGGSARPWPREAQVPYLLPPSHCLLLK